MVWKNYKNTGISHPLCWTHECDDHNSDTIISEFGTGLKSASVCIGDRLDIQTRYKDRETGDYNYERDECDWNKMTSKNTFNPNILH